jgi:hypothetical protein
LGGESVRCVFGLAGEGQTPSRRGSHGAALKSMFKTGIYKRSQLPRAGETLFRRELKNLSITLYDQLAGLPGGDEQAERVLQLFADERGSYKRTYGRRFEEFDQQVLARMETKFSPAGPLRVEDVGVSDGRTSCELFRKLVARYPQLCFRASDYDAEVFVIEQGRTKVTLSHAHRVLEIVYPPFVFNISKRDSYRHYPLNHVVRSIIDRLIVRGLVARYLAGQVSPHRIALFAPEALELAAQDSRFQLARHDLLAPLATPGKVDLIRAMNVLNLSYFGRADIQMVLSNMHTALRDEGWLVTGSNDEAGSLVHGGIYQRSPAGFDAVWESGNGSPFRSQICASVASAASRQ